MSRLLTRIIQPMRFFSQALCSTLQTASTVKSCLVTTESPSLSFVRTKVRCYFPRPNEVRRVRRHGWETRMSTPKGRKIIMRRLLKGRFVLSH